MVEEDRGGYHVETELRLCARYMAYRGLTRIEWKENEVIVYYYSVQFTLGFSSRIC